MNVEGRLKKIEDYTFLSENAYEILKDAIITLTFEPGEKLNLSKITRELGISTTPVREAMNRLIQEGFVVNVPFKGAFVSDVDSKMVEQLAECGSCWRLRPSSGRPSSSPRAMQRWGRSLAKLEAAYEKNDVTEYVEYSMQFHGMFVDRCDNELMANVIRGFNDHVKRIAFLALRRQKKISPFATDYRGILNALIKRNPEKAGKLLAEHVRKVRYAFNGEKQR